MILVVDDTEEFIDIVLDTLGDDYEMLVCMDGESALEVAEAEQPELILLDILMPGMDGYTVCETLKANPATRDIPVIFLTVKVDVEDERKGFDLGGVDYITKPISPPTLQARVRTHLEIRESRLKLEEQNRQLQQAIRLREDVERMMRHDLKNPLAAILGEVEVMRLRGEGDPKRLQVIQDMARRVLHMADHTLDLYKMEQGTYPYQPELIRLDEAVAKVIEEHRIAIGEKVLRVEVKQAEDGVSAHAEAALTHTMLSNLLRNAVEASPKEAQITIRITRQAERPTIVIENQGAVPASIRDRFFDKYATADKADGTGLGTYTAKLIAEVQGGAIDMSVTDEQITTVTVHFAQA